ncbi:hypothetical protein PEX1_032880 [Penicillium expansum]|uniref:Carboxymuconolactone decarboxylase n=1 Tax=Penicillium expansum TaxID=27334 RepID=A0A0A2JC95_PENEN|nr:hypothetical protein PEX2_108840 [Penicillium expansum]KGO52233.1 hypothetical protein PEX2_108840 [Penicillium expansum]KGO71963.1 hypothetical protein PEX1_032880 [Penicillium expansum]
MQIFDPLTPAEAIHRIIALQQDGSCKSIWYCIAASAYASANAGPQVTEVYKVAIANTTSAAERRHILQRILETLIKGTMLYGVPRLLNSFYPLVSYVEKEGLLEGTSPEPVLDVRKNMANPFDLQERGLKYFQNIYRDDMDKIFAPMHKFAPDIKQLSVLLEYGPYLSETSILSPIETSQITIAALVALDVPMQVKWHMRGLIRNQGTADMVEYALHIAEIVRVAEGVQLKNGLPDLRAIQEETLF